MRDLLKWLLSGRMPALAAAATFLLLSLLLPPLTLLSAAVVVLATLEKGAREGANTVAASALAAGLFGAILFGKPLPLILYGLATWLPPYLGALLFRLGSLGLAFEGLALLGALLVGLASLLVGELEEFWRQLLLSRVDQLPLQEEAVAGLARVMTGLVGAALVLHFKLALLLGLAAQGRLHDWPLGELFLRLKPSRWLALLTLLLLLAGLAGSLLAVNLTLPLLVPFFTVGMVSLHLVLRRRGRWPLLLFYLALLLIPHLLVPVTVVGLVDPWIDLREKFLKESRRDSRWR